MIRGGGAKKTPAAHGGAHPGRLSKARVRGYICFARLSKLGVLKHLPNWTPGLAAPKELPDMPEAESNYFYFWSWWYRSYWPSGSATRAAFVAG